MCGFIGIVTAANAVAPLIYEGLLCLQHRGQDAAGMVTFDRAFELKKGNGLVRDVFRAKNMERLTGNMGIGHVRYPTIGAGSSSDAQPFLINFPYGIAMAHNGNVTNHAELNKFMVEKKTLINSSCDVELILNVLAIELGRMGVPDLTPEVLFQAVDAVLRHVKGSYSVVALIADYGVLAFRDPFGIRPMIYGERRNDRGSFDYATASENVALDIIGFSNWRDVQPGEAVLFRPGEPVVRHKVLATNHHPCIFEHVYFARPDSVIDGMSVYQSRRNFGQKLATKIKKLGLKIDVVIPIPDSACTAAGTLASALGVEYREGFVKNRYIGRTFIMPDQQHRTDGIRRKLNAIPMEFAGKDVLLVDDSIVRGNTSRKIVELARQAGARKVYFASCSPPVQHPCVYGIDMATRKELVARGREIDAIRREIDADALIYQDLADLEESARSGNSAITEFCTACFSGNYPTQDITREMFDTIEQERLCVRD
ncbi:MAG: amidophosphoribosyltransferase [Planctomycetota bacterium]